MCSNSTHIGEKEMKTVKKTTPPSNHPNLQANSLCSCIYKHTNNCMEDTQTYGHINYFLEGIQTYKHINVQVIAWRIQKDTNIHTYKHTSYLTEGIQTYKLMLRGHTNIQTYAQRAYKLTNLYISINVSLSSLHEINSSTKYKKT